ncbi:MAG: CoA transferase [Halieaceae bacterium]|nr:CoA transferase [Halieaceae bacterium]
MSGPLDGYRVVELTSTVSGPIAGMILADQGADVIKIEPPMIGDLARYMGSSRNGMGAMYAVLNRNKRSLVLDFKEASDKNIFSKLIQTADVLIENYRPGVVKKLGINYDTLRVLQPELIYVSISGYGQTGPYSKRRVYDPLIQASSGTAAEQSKSRPTNVRTVMFDKVTGFTAAQAITAALLQRVKTGFGQYIPISMLESALYYQWPDVMWSHTLVGKNVNHAGELADYFQIYKAKDGYLAVILVSDEHFRTFCGLFGSRLIDDPRFSSFPSRIINADELRNALDAVFSEALVDDICRQLDINNVPCSRVNTLEDVHKDQQVVHEETLVEVVHPVAGPMRFARTPFRFTGQGDFLKSHAATLGEHNRDILQELDVPEIEIKKAEERERLNREKMTDFNLSQAK